MAQQTIDYGNFPDDASADAIRIAFQKTQDNFTELYGNLSNIASNVTAITAGSGIIVSSSTGDVTIDSIFSSLNIHSNTLSITGVGGIVTPGGNIGEDYTVNNASSTLIVELNSVMDVTFANITADGNLIVNGNSISAANANITLTNGNITLTNGSFNGDIVTSYGANTVQFADYYSVVSGDPNFTYDPVGANLSLTNGNLNASTITSQYLLNASNVHVSNSVIVTNSVSAGTLTSSGNVNGVNGNLTGNLHVVGNIITDGNITADLLTGDGQYITNMNASSLTSGTVSFLLLSGQYSIDITGTADTAHYVIESDQTNITSVGTLTSLDISNELSGNTANFSGPITASSIQIDQIQFSGLTSDPPAADGLLYYNSSTGKLRLYNGITTSWQDLN